MQMIANLLRSVCAKNCRNSVRFDKDIAHIEWCGSSVDINLLMMLLMLSADMSLLQWC